MDLVNQEDLKQSKSKSTSQSDLYNFLRTIVIGFGIVSIGIVIALVGYIVVTKSLR